MTKNILNYLLLAILAGFVSQPALAADSYRYFHVTIDTPWAIFIFLLLIILFPFVLSAVLYWYFTFKKAKEQSQSDTAATDTTTEEQKTQ